MYSIVWTACMGYPPACLSLVLSLSVYWFVRLVLFSLSGLPSLVVAQAYIPTCLAVLP